MDVVDLPHSDHGPHGGMPVILLHGFPLDHRMWRAQRDALVAAGHRVIVPDLRGAGKAPLGHATATMAAHAGDVLRLADRAGLRRFALVGFSMGGYVALEVARQLAATSTDRDPGHGRLEVARQAPQRLAGLALVDTRAEPDTDEARAGRMATIEKVRASGMPVLADAMLPKMLTPAAPPALVEDVRAMMLAQRSEGAMHALAAMAGRPDARPTLAQVRVPTLVLVGEEDAVTPPAAARAMADAVPGATLVAVPGAAHLAPMERPDAVSAALVAWAHGCRG